MLLAGHLDEAEPLRRAGEELALHLGRFHLAERLEQRDELVLGRLRRQVAYENVHLGLLDWGLGMESMVRRAQPVRRGVLRSSAGMCGSRRAGAGWRDGEL